MKAIIYISGVIGEETSLTDVIRQFKSYESPSEVEVNIHSEGGNVDEGDAIFEYLNGIKKDLPLNTYATKAYSIAAKILSVGEKIFVADEDKVVMIHFAWAEVKGKAEKLEIVAEFLREKENEFAAYYAEFLNIDENSARSLLDNETFLSGQEAVELGFATELKTATKAVAKYEPKNINLKTSKMTKEKKGMLKAFAAFLGIAQALVLQDSSGTEIEFADVEDGKTPVVGDAGTIGGEKVSDGEYIIPSMNDATVVFVDGKISEIKPLETPAEEEVDVNAEVIKEVMNWEVETSSTSFNEGDTLEYDYDGETYSFGVGEYFIPSIGKSVVTDANGVIVKVKESVAPAEDTVAANAKIDAEIAKVVNGIEAKVSAKFETKLKAQEEKIKALNKLVGSREFKAQEEEAEAATTSGKGQGNYMSNILRQGRKK